MLMSSFANLAFAAVKKVYAVPFAQPFLFDQYGEHSPQGIQGSHNLSHISRPSRLPRNKRALIVIRNALGQRSLTSEAYLDQRIYDLNTFLHVC